MLCIELNNYIILIQKLLKIDTFVGLYKDTVIN